MRGTQAILTTLLISLPTLVGAQSEALLELFGPELGDSNLPTLQVQAAISPESVAVGTKAELQVQVFIPRGWHIYSIEPAGEFGPEPTSLRLPPDYSSAGPLQESVPVRQYDAALEQELWIHQVGLELRQRFYIPVEAKEGMQKLRATLEYQVCDNRICAPLQQLSVTAWLNILESGENKR